MESQLNRFIDTINDQLIELNAQISCSCSGKKSCSSNDQLSKETLVSTTHSLRQAVEIIKQVLVRADLAFFPRRMITEDLDLSNLCVPFRTIACPNPLGSALASNNQRLLMDQRSHLQLFDQNLILTKQYPWKIGFIRDMCWSSVLNNFIVITNNQRIYLVNEDITTMSDIQNLPEEDWSSCTCSESSLFLTTNDRGSGVFQFHLSPIMQFIKIWTPPESCQEHELIRDIDYNNQTLAFIVEDSLSNMVHLELRSSENLHRIWSFRSDISYQIVSPAIRCCSLPYNQWLLIDSNHSRLFHIDSQGQMKSSHVYKSSPWNAILYHSNVLAIRTENSLNFHRIY